MKCFNYFKRKSRTSEQKSAPAISVEGSKLDNSAAVHGSSFSISTASTASSHRSIPALYEEKAQNLCVFSYSELRNATNDFSLSLKIGEGGFGSVYKGFIRPPNGDGKQIVVAIKKLNTNGLQGHKQWIAEVQFLGIVEHPNLVKLVGYCAVDGERGIQRLLVYEFMSNKSLEDHLFNRASPVLPWNTRLHIILGAAQGLAYLHEELEVQVLVRSLKVLQSERKSSNYTFTMSNLPKDQILQMETTCGSLLYELQIIWDEVGESDAERDKLLLELEQECLEVYRRKVDRANRLRAQLRQAIADSEAELAAICSAMGERPVHLRQSDQNTGNLKEELRVIIPQLEEMRKRKNDRLSQFNEVVGQIQKISKEIFGPGDYTPSDIVVDQNDLSIRKLDELHKQLEALQKKKSDRLKQVLDHLNILNSLCLVLGMDFQHMVGEIHPSLDDNEASMSISDETIKRLTVAIQRLREIKIQRMQKLQDLATTMLELWNLMDTPLEEQQMFQNVTCNIAASEHEMKEPGTLSVDFINYVEAEVLRLEELKASKMKELVLKKRSELDEICRQTHLVAEADSSMEYAIEAIESGTIDPSCVLEQVEVQIAKVKEEAFNRKEILEKVEKWLAACEEESWLEEYNRDENRYNAGRGAHLTLKRAEKARALVAKLPAIVEALACKITTWERERGVDFTYDGVRLLSMLEEYTILRQEKEQEQRRQRDQKRLQGQLIAEQEAIFGSKPSPSKPLSSKKPPRTSTGSANRRMSLGGALLQTPKFDPHSGKHGLVGIASRPNRKDDGVATLSADRRGLDVVGLPMKKHSFETEALIRKPLSQVTALSSKANTGNALEGLNISHNRPPAKAVASNNMLATTPSKQTFVTNEENRNPEVTTSLMPTTPLRLSESTQTATTPVCSAVLFAGSVEEIQPPLTPEEMPILVPPTPSTVSVPMQMSMTPASASIPFETGALKMPDETEYSFEEWRAGFIVPMTHLKSVQV